MILLDTNVISELMRAEPAQIVLDWFGQHDASDLFISAITEAELRTGVAILPDGQRRDRLQAAIDAMIDQDFQSRVLPFDSLAAQAYAEIAAQRLAGWWQAPAAQGPMVQPRRDFGRYPRGALSRIVKATRRWVGFDSAMPCRHDLLADVINCSAGQRASAMQVVRAPPNAKSPHFSGGLVKR